MPTIRRRKSKRKGTRYEVTVRVSGHSPSYTTFGTLEEAKEWASTEEHRLRSQSPGYTSKATLGDACLRYAETVMHRKKASTARSQLQRLDWWREEYGETRLRDVSARLISDARDKLAKGRSPATVNRYLAILSHVLTVASREWQWIPSNPCRNVDRLTEPPGRVRYLSRDELARLLDACRPDTPLYALVLLTLTTGMRRGEVLALTWDRVDLRRRTLWLDDTKNRDRRGMPISPEVAKVLVSLPRHIGDSRLFPWADVPSKRIPGWYDVLTAAKIADFRFHDLRHTAASYLAMSGASTVEIANVLGHKALEMAKRYAHLSPEHLREVMGRLSASLLGAQEGRKDDPSHGKS